MSKEGRRGKQMAATEEVINLEESSEDEKESVSSAEKSVLSFSVHPIISKILDNSDAIYMIRRECKTRDEAREEIVRCLGPASGDVLAETRGCVFTTDREWSSSSSEGEDSEDEEKSVLSYEVHSVIENLLDNCSVLSQIRRESKTKGEAREKIIQCLGPADGDILAETRGKVFADDTSEESESSEEEDEDEYPPSKKIKLEDDDQSSGPSQSGSGIHSPGQSGLTPGGGGSSGEPGIKEV